jgi:hypothetical protein
MVFFIKDYWGWYEINRFQPYTYTPVNKAGDTMTGALVAQANTNYTTAQLRNVIESTSAASGGSNGDVWLQYTA